MVSAAAANDDDCCAMYKVESRERRALLSLHPRLCFAALRYYVPRPIIRTDGRTNDDR